MLSFYPSTAHSHYSPLYSARPVYADDDIIYLNPSATSEYSYLPRANDPEAHYRCAFTEYLVAEQELIRAREEATLRARAEALRRQEEARILRARIVRARNERQVQQLRQVLAQKRAAALAAKTAIPEVRPPLPCAVPFAGSAPERCRTPISNVPSARTPQTFGSFMDGRQLLVSVPTKGEGQREHRSAARLAPKNGNPAPTLESLLQARLRKVASGDEDEEVQDLARATLDHLFRHFHEGGANNTSALSSETKHDSGTQSTEGTDLSRSDALQGAAAEAAKESFKAHRAAQAAPPASKAAITPLETIQDIRASLAGLSADFSVPPSLDFSDDEANGLAYTPTNAPVRVYEHALEGLLAQLDAIESDGDEEVRVARRTVVQEVEMALEGVEEKVKRAREAAQDTNKSGEDDLAEATSSSFDLVEDEDTHTRAESASEAKAEEDEHSASIPSHIAAISYSSPAQVSASEVDVVSNTAYSADVVPENSAVEDIPSEEWTEVVLPS